MSLKDFEKFCFKDNTANGILKVFFQYDTYLGICRNLILESDRDVFEPELYENVCKRIIHFYSKETDTNPWEALFSKIAPFCSAEEKFCFLTHLHVPTLIAILKKSQVK
ncbi:MAG: hypothetical protein ACK5N8_06320 [Alphaproteobacteria bacterium]